MLIIIILLSIWFVPIFNTYSSDLLDKTNYRFKKIGIEEGLSQSTVLSIAQDRRGYIWFGTASGLNRYDGYEFKVYNSNNEDPFSLSGNKISALFEDSNGFLWVGTNSGVLNKFDPNTEDFIHYDIANTSDWFSSEPELFSDYPFSFSRNSNNAITTIVEDNNGELWVGSWGKGIVKFNPIDSTRKYYYSFQNRKNSLTSNKITKIVIDSRNTIWIGTFGGGLNRIRSITKDSLIIEDLNEKLNYDFGKKITALYEDSEKNIWVGSYDGDVSLINNSSSSGNKIINPTPINIGSLNDGSETNFMSIVEDKNSNIWIGTYGEGLFCYSLKTKMIKHFLSIESDPYSLSDNEIQSLFVDKSGILWVGMQLGSGINKLEIGANKFNTLPIRTENNKSLNDNIIWAILEDSESKIWIGTHRGGINIWDKEKDYFNYYSKNENLSDNHIRSFAEDKYGNLWIGTYSNSLIHYHRKSNSFKNMNDLKNYDNTLSGNQIQALLIDGDSLLFVGSFGGGLNILNLNAFYDSSKVSFTNYIHNPAERKSLSDNRIYTMFKDSDNQIWIGSHGGGINKFNKKDNSFERIHIKQDTETRNFNNRIMVINETREGNLLIGTFGGGLNLYDKNEKELVNLNNRINFNFSDVYGIIPDSTGYWLSTDNGIIKVNHDLNAYTQFDISDGLQSLEFSGGAYHSGRDGIFYFGGIKGLNYFDPKSIEFDDYIPPIVISNKKVFDRVINGDKKNLIFNYKENYFSFEFASLDFRNSKKNKYKFMMEGLDSKWSFTNAENRTVFYPNLSPGNYRFRVMGTNADGIWSPNEASLNITILGPFWMSWWFISGLILFLGTVITFFINQRFRYLVALDKLKTNIAADLHDNVGAGLTEISILSELASNQINKPNNAQKHISQITDLSRQLVESMSDIVWVVNPSVGTLYDLIVRLKDMYGELLSDMEIKLSTSNLERLVDIKLPMDYKQNLYLILKEAINNSIKHSHCKLIEIKINITKNKLNVKLRDDGIGFDMEDTPVRNGLVNIRKRGEKIGGGVTIISSPDKGTTIEYEGIIR